MPSHTNTNTGKKRGPSMFENILNLRRNTCRGKKFSSTHKFLIHSNVSGTGRCDNLRWEDDGSCDSKYIDVGDCLAILLFTL